MVVWAILEYNQPYPRLEPTILYGCPWANQSTMQFSGCQITKYYIPGTINHTVAEFPWEFLYKGSRALPMGQL